MKIEVKLDTTELEAALTSLTNAMRDTTPLMQGLAQVMAEASDRAFENECDPITGAKWPKLHPDYKAQRAEAGHTGPMLQRNGTLRTSMHQEYGHLYARYGTNLTYAAIHCFGGITRRPLDTPARQKGAGVAPRAVSPMCAGRSCTPAARYRAAAFWAQARRINRTCKS